MRRCILILTLLLPASLWSGSPADEYPISVHVVSSSFVTVPSFGGGAGVQQKLNVVIGGKKYELTEGPSKGGLLALGDYKAKLIKDEHATAYESRQEYEFQFPDKKTRKFYVTGQSE